MDTNEHVNDERERGEAYKARKPVLFGFKETIKAQLFGYGRRWERAMYGSGE